MKARAPSDPSVFERAAAASAVAIVAGLILPRAAFHSLDRALLVWLTFSVLIGLMLGTKAQLPLRKVLAIAALPATLLPLSCAVFWVVRFAVDWVKEGAAPRVMLGFSTVPADVTSPAVVLLLGVLLLILFIGTYLVVILSSIGKRPIVALIVRTIKLGPDGFERVQKSLVAIGGVAAALVALWAFVGGDRL